MYLAEIVCNDGSFKMVYEGNINALLSIFDNILSTHNGSNTVS